MADTYVCARCGAEHEGPPLAYDFPDVPASVASLVDGPEDLERRAQRDADTFAIDDHFWLKGLLELPVHDADDSLLFGVWVELQPDVRAVLEEVLDTPELPNYLFEGAFDTIIWPYKNALGLGVHLAYSRHDDRPQVTVADDHALARHQRDGITLEHVHEIAARIEHMDEELAAIDRGEVFEFYE